MKKTLLFLPALLLYVLPAAAQRPGDYQFQFQFENTLSEWVPAYDGIWYGAGWSVSYPGYPMGVPFVVKWDAKNDSLLWTQNVPMPLAEDVWDVALLPAVDGGVYVGAAFDGCDYGTPDGLARLDTDGNILWSKATPQNTGWSSKIWLLPYPDGHLLYQTDHYQIEYDADGQVEWTDVSSFKWNGIASRQDGGYLVYGDQKTGTTDLLLSIVEKSIDDNIFHALQLPSGDWLLLGEQQLYRIASDFSVQLQKPVGAVKPWSKIVEAGGDYWMTGADANGTGLLQRIDTATLDVLSTHHFGQNYRVTSALHAPGDSLLWLSGDGNFDRNQTVFLKSTPRIDPVIAPTRSLALVDIRLEAPPKGFLQNCQNWDGGNYGIDFGRVFVTVKNTGAAPVQKFRVNGHFKRCSFICTSYEQISEEFDLTLLPGDSLELLLLNNFDLNGQQNNNVFNLCFWTAVPDDRLDANPDDDRFCKTFSVLVSDQEPVVAANSVRVFPNPAAGDMTFVVESPEEEYALTLTDLSGQVVLQEHFSGSVYQLPRRLLPAGIYFYEISNQQGRLGAGKVVFME